MLYSVGHTGGLTLEDFPPPSFCISFEGASIQCTHIQTCSEERSETGKREKQGKREKESMNEKEERKKHYLDPSH